VLRLALVCVALSAGACGAGARRVNPVIGAGPRDDEPALGFEFSCTFAPGRKSTPASARRLCASRRSEHVTASRTDDGGLRIRIRFRDSRRHRLDLYLYRQGGRTLRGAMLVERHGEDRIEVEPDRGWIAVEHLDVLGRSAAGRYALTFGGVRVGGSFAVNLPPPPADGRAAAPAQPLPRPQRARRP
jgi:hypothetical protein